MSCAPIGVGFAPAIIDRAEAAEAAGAVDEDLVPDPARVLVDDLLVREIEALPGKIGDHILGVVGDASAAAVVGDGNNFAMDGAAVDGAQPVAEKRLMHPIV